MDKTISEMFEEIKEEMCDKYCKYIDQLGEEEIDELCSDCPLNRLRGNVECYQLIMNVTDK